MENKKVHQDQFYIEGLLSSNSKVVDAIYKKFVPKVKSYIRLNSGNDEDANDVVQEVLIIIYNQAKTKGLELTCPFDAYFFLLCKRRWLNQLKKPHNKEVTITEDHVSKDATLLELISETETQDEKYQLFQEMFLQLGDKCQELLKLSFVTKTMEEVAEKLNVTYGYVRKKKSLCTAKLTRLIKESSRYKTIKEESND